MLLPMPWRQAEDLIGRLERAATVFLKQYDLRLVSDQKFNNVRFSSKYDWGLRHPGSDIFYILISFRANWKTDNDFEALVQLPVAAGQWAAGSITYSLLDGPEFFAQYLHETFGFSVAMVHEKFDEFKEDYEQIRLQEQEERVSTKGRP